MYNSLMTAARGIAAALAAVTLGLAPPPGAVPAVERLAVPDGGIQPQAAFDAGGTLHVIYYKGDSAGGDLFYVRRGARGTRVSAPIRVNSEAGSAIARGAVRGGRLALGANGWVHVAWNAAHAVAHDGGEITPMWYARLAPGAAAFEPQRAIGVHTTNLDGGGTVAADRSGHVFVVWHAEGAQAGETHRQMVVAASSDSGAHFAPDRVYDAAGGACSCCGVTALVDRDGRLQILYRSAAEGVHRDATWLTLDVRGATAPAAPSDLQPWNLPACPMTTFALAETPRSLVGAWVIEQQIYAADLDPALHTASAPAAMAGTAVRNHPSIAVDAQGNRLFAWIEGANRSREGSAAWEMQDARGARIGSASAAGFTPPLSLVAAVARPGGGFLVIF
jgi:hypothetical protein